MRMSYEPTKYACVRCQEQFQWEQLKSTPEGNLFCPTCWQTMDSQREAKRKCPVDNTEMHKKMIAELAVIDNCPSCGGTWFDKGELQIIEKLAEARGWDRGYLLGLFL